MQIVSIGVFGLLAAAMGGPQTRHRPKGRKGPLGPPDEQHTGAPCAHEGPLGIVALLGKQIL